MSALPTPRPKAWPLTAAIPVELRERDRWVCWRWATDKSGRPTKTPHSPRTGALCDITSPSSWATYDAAMDTMTRHGADGVGIVVTDDDSLSGGDIDNCRDAATGEIQAWALDIIEAVDTYTEITPSGSGVRFFAHAKLPVGSRCSRVWESGKVELYSRARYLTVTGSHLPGTPSTVNERQTQWDSLHARLFARVEQRQSTPEPTAPLDLDDEQLLQVIRRSAQAGKFDRLNAGDLTDHGGDHSSADLAFCSMLAFWTGRDSGRIDDLFRRSGLMRPKWDSRRGDKSESARAINAVVSLARSHEDVIVSPAQLDADPWLLNVQNGVLDMREGKLVDHSPDRLITKLAPVTFDARATCPRWLEYLSDVFPGGYSDVIPFLQRAVGYSLTGITTEECFFILVGGGRNGKGTLIKIIAALLGSYAAQADFSSFIQRKDDSAPREDIAAMRGAYFVAAQESRERATFAEALIKNLTGGDTIRARRLHENGFEFTPRL